MDEGLVYFDSMSLFHDVSPTVEHYACMVDFLVVLAICVKQRS